MIVVSSILYSHPPSWKEKVIAAEQQQHTLKWLLLLFISFVLWAHLVVFLFHLVLPTFVIQIYHYCGSKMFSNEKPPLDYVVSPRVLFTDFWLLFSTPRYFHLMLLHNKCTYMLASSPSSFE